MDAKDYLLKINQICNWNSCNKDGCPLYKFGCGIPTNDIDIDKVIGIVEQYEEKTFPFGYCNSCGQEFNSELINEYQIINCPWCGTKIM